MLKNDIPANLKFVRDVEASHIEQTIDMHMNLFFTNEECER